MDPGLTIVLLGNSGVGKSASGNTILGRPAFESRKAFRSVTKQISEVTETVFEKQISVVDTPGILGSEGKVQTRCQDLLQSSRPCLFLVVVKIDRFTIEQKNAVEKAIRAVGDQDFNKCYLLFTGGDDLDNMSVDEFINEDPEGPLPPLVERFAGRHHVFNNENGGPEQVRELLMKSGHLRINPEEVDEMRIVLLGLPGHGKSASGNTILGFERFESAPSFNAVTTESVCKSEIINKCKIKVVDTPGFTGTKLSPRKLFDEIMKSVEMASPGPHCFIIVVKIDRISDTDVKLLKMLPKLFSREAPKHAMVLITHGDALGQRQSIGDLIDSNDQMSRLVSMCSGRYCVFDNAKKVNRVQKGNKVQVENLLDKIHDMVRANGGQHYTSEMFHNSQDIRVKIDIKWHELGQWFIRMIRELDACRRHNGYTLVREMEETLKHIRHQHQCS